MSELSTIENLGKENFDSWRLQTDTVFIKNDHWDYITGVPRRPEASSIDEKNWTQKDKKRVLI